MSNETKKQQVAAAALDYVKAGDTIGVGTGSTVDHFITILAKNKTRIEGAVASSKTTQSQLESHGIAVFDLNQTGDLPVYIDGADEANAALQLIKGGGGALTREKIIAAASRQFICIIDNTKQVRTLGAFPLPVEVIPMAQSMVARKISILGGTPRLRLTDGGTSFITDNNNIILDIIGLDMKEPIAMETQLNQIPGVVSVGLFALRPADILLIGTDKGVTTHTRG